MGVKTRPVENGQQGMQVDPSRIIDGLLRQIAQLNYELALRDAVIAQLQGTGEIPQSEVTGAGQPGT